MEINRMKLRFVRRLFLVAALLTIGNMSFAATGEISLKLDKKTIKAMIKTAQPLIEDITGRDFKKKVKFKLVKRDVVRDAVVEATLPLQKKLIKGENDDVIARQVETVAITLSQSSLGLYDPLGKKFLIVPDNVEYRKKTLGLNEKDFHDFVFLVVAHELVHVLDDQYFDLQRIHESVDNLDALGAFAALREGHAVYVTNQIAERLKLSDAAEDLSVKSAAGVMGAGNRAQMQIFHSTYVKGSEFVEAIVEKKGVPGVSEAFASPPVSTRQIMAPEEYFSPAFNAGLDCSKLLENITTALPIEGMQTQSVSLGATALSATLIAQGISEDEAHSVANKCMSGAVFIAAKQTLKPKTLTVIAVNFSSRESAAQFLEMSNKLDASAEAQFNAKLNSSYIVVEEAALELDGFDTVRYRHVEKTTNGVVTTALSAEGLVDSVYICATFLNMQETITEEQVSEIITALGHERLKML